MFCGFAATTQAQLVFLGDDESDNKKDGYEAKLVGGGLVEQRGVYFFTTPNGHLYSTTGQEATTKVLQSFPGSEGLFLAATKRFIYYGVSSESGTNLMQYDPATNKVNSSLYGSDPYERFTLNAVTVPGTRTRADEEFVHPDKSKIFFRTFKHDRFRISAIHDDAPNSVNIVAVGDMPTTANPDVLIAVGTKPAFFKNEVYYNGRVKRPKVGHYETSASSAIVSSANPLQYDILSDFFLEEKKFKMFEGFLRSKTKICSMVQTIPDTGIVRTKLLVYDQKVGNTSKTSLNVQADDYAGENINGNIFISCKGYIWKYNDEKDNYWQLIDDKKSVWGKITEKNRFLEANDFLMYLSGSSFGTIGYQTTIKRTIHSPVTIPEPNRYDVGPRYAYAASKCFYFIDNVNNVLTFTQYDPYKDQYTPIVFPEFKKEKFTEIRGIFQSGDRFLFLTKYTGKKDKPVYKMFMYTEQAN